METIDPPEHYRQLGFTREDDECIRCPKCEAEHWFPPHSLPPDKCDICGELLWKGPIEE